MKSLILFLFLAYTIQLKINAQDSFILKESGPHSLNLPQDFDIKPDGNMLFLFSSIPQEGSTYVNKICEINPSGETVSTFTFNASLNDYAEYQHGLIIGDTLYVFGIEYETLGVNSYLPIMLMHKFDLQLNLNESYRFAMNQVSPYRVKLSNIKYINGKFYFVSSFGPTGNIRPIFASISKKGEIIDFVIEGEPGKNLMPYDFTIKEDGDLQTYALSSGYIAPQLMCGLVCNYNANFEIEYYSELPHLLTLFHSHAKSNDSVYYLSGQWIDQNASPPWHAGIFKMKNDTTVVYEFLYTTYPDTTACPAYYHSIEVLPDGNLIFCFIGNVLNNFYPQSEPAKINLMKLTPDFEVIWHRYIGEPDKKYDPYVMCTNDSDEIVILGACSQAQPGFNLDMDILFIKTTPDGLITGTHDDNPGIRTTETLLYPNPASDRVAIEYSMAYTGATLEIRSINGQGVFTTQLTANRQSVDISGIAPGTYVYRIFNKQGLDESGKLVVE